MKFNQKGFTVVEGLLVVVAVAVVGFGSYYVWNENRSSDTGDANETTNTIDTAADGSSDPEEATSEELDSSERTTPAGYIWVDTDEFSYLYPTDEIWGAPTNSVQPVESAIYKFDFTINMAFNTEISGWQIESDSSGDFEVGAPLDIQTDINSNDITVYSWRRDEGKCSVIPLSANMISLLFVDGLMIYQIDTLAYCNDLSKYLLKNGNYVEKNEIDNPISTIIESIVIN